MLRRWTVTAAILAGLTLSGGCAGGDGTSEGGDPTTPATRRSTTTTAPPRTTTTMSPEEEALTTIATGPEDLDPGQKALPGLREDDPEHPTLGYCGQFFEADDHRVARRELDYRQGPDVLGTTAVARYEDGYAEQALAELRAAVAACPADATDELAGGTVQIQAQPLAERDLAGLLDDRLALVVRTGYDGGAPSTSYEIYQRRADVVIAIKADDAPTALRRARNAAARALAAPAADVGA